MENQPEERKIKKPRPPDTNPVKRRPVTIHLDPATAADVRTIDTKIQELKGKRDIMLQMVVRLKGPEVGVKMEDKVKFRLSDDGMKLVEMEPTERMGD